ncbi:MAG: DMT family transporter [Rhizobiales bacterium]|nr:DMT family transporter [Hyphomicrobiales bacterium]
MIHRAAPGIVCALISAVFYGAIPNFSRAAYENGVPPVESTFFRTSLIAVAFAIIAILQSQSFRVPRGAWSSLAVQSLATLVISVGYLASVQFIPVGLAVIVFFTFPVLILLAAPFAEGHAPEWTRIAVALIAFTGLAIAIGPNFDTLDWRGLALAGAASICGVLQFFSGRTISRYLAPTVFGTLAHVIIWPATLAVAIYVGGGKLAFVPGGGASSTGIAFMMALGAVYIAAYLTHMLSLRFAPASTVAPFFNLEPVVTTVIAATLLGERLALNQYAGGALVLAALVLSGWIGMRKAQAR